MGGNILLPVVTFRYQSAVVTFCYRNNLLPVVRSDAAAAALQKVHAAAMVFVRRAAAILGCGAPPVLPGINVFSKLYFSYFLIIMQHLEGAS